MMYTKLYESLSKARYDDSPWEHHTFGQALTEAQVDEIRNLVRYNFSSQNKNPY